MKAMKVPRGTARAARFANSGTARIAPPSATAQAAMLADQRRANRKLGVKLFHKSGSGIA